jgi:homoserine/homoserine lactone efflux protein
MIVVDPALYLAFVAAATVLVIMPGPNIALIVANSLAHGPKYGLLTVAGTSSAMIAQLALTIVGMTTALSLLAEWFELLRWIGVAYLVYLGVRTWCASAVDIKVVAEPKSMPEIYLRGFLVSFANPKTLFFYAAFLPQFVTSSAEPFRQLLVLAATFLLIAVVFDSLCALLAAQLRPMLHGKGKVKNRVTGALLLVAGVGLAMVRRT